MGLEIWLPPSTEPPAYRCNVPVNMDGDPCGQAFFEGQERQYRRHVARCAGEHEQVIRDLHIFQRGAELFDGGDRELFRWSKDHAREILEGRRKL